MTLRIGLVEVSTFSPAWWFDVQQIPSTLCSKGTKSKAGSKIIPGDVGVGVTARVGVVIVEATVIVAFVPREASETKLNNVNEANEFK